MVEPKKRGRPRKKPIDTSLNEQKKEIKMSENDVVTSIPDEKVTLSDVQTRWQSLFGKYATMGYDAISSTWNRSLSSLSNPFIQNERIKQINSTASKLSKESLQKALASPESSEDAFRKVSMYLYYTNYIYNNLIRLDRDTPLFNYYASPLYITKKEAKSEEFLKESQQVDRILKKFNPRLTFKTITSQVKLEGKSSYLPRQSYSKNDVDFFVMQKLNSDMVKYTGFGSKQQFISSFNMMIFLQPGYDVSQYPQFIQDAWEEMMNGGIVVKDRKGLLKVNPKADVPTGNILEYANNSYLYWIQLPQDLCYTFYTDGTTPMAFPDTIGLFADFNDLGDYRWLQANLLTKGINSVLTAEVPCDKNAKAGTDATIISPDVILGYQDLFSSSVSGNIFPFFAPFEKFTMHSLENQPESMDIIYNRTRDLIATSGNSALLTISDKPSIASVKAAQNIQASKIHYLTLQFENFLNTVINSNFGLKFKWKITLEGDIFNWREDAKITKELVLAGAKGLLPKLLSYEGITLEDYIGATFYIDSLGIKLETDKDKIDKKTTETNPVGRPKLADDEIENDNTATSSDMGNNVSDTKDFSLDDKRMCLICGEELADDEEFICDVCLQTKYEERIDDNV